MVRLSLTNRGEELATSEENKHPDLSELRKIGQSADEQLELLTKSRRVYKIR